MPSDAYLRSRQALQTPIHTLHGVGPKVQEKFKRLGIETLEDLLYTLPHRYEDRRRLYRLAQLPHQGRIVVSGQVLAAGEVRKRRRMYEVIISDGTGQLSLKWFNYRRSWMKNRFPNGRWLLAIGEIKRFGGQVEMSHPELEFLPEKPNSDILEADDQLGLGRILPVYPLTEGLTQRVAQKVWSQTVSYLNTDTYSAIPCSILDSENLLKPGKALSVLHHPQPETEPQDLEKPQSIWRRSLVFDEFFFLQLGLALRRKGLVSEEGRAFKLEHRYTKPLAQMLPYKLTNAQRRVLGEIKEDMLAPHPMNRLVQGDVGSGKTIVALMAGLIAIENNAQVAVVAPTEILAEQHFFQFKPWLEQLGLTTVLLTGSMSARERKERLVLVAEGSAHLVVGTHAVLQDGVAFKNLGLGIIDEQHRFGVRQRGALKQKGAMPDMLVMTATPIPRTLSMTLYGDLAVSVIDELPPGRKPIQTRLVMENHRNRAYEHLTEQLKQGRQAYIVYPLVEESEKSDLKAATEAAQQLKETILNNYSVGLLHGKMKSSEKETIMRQFKAAEIDVLVSTTVIEVGVDVPNATVMLIEHAERFGLAQLHQLRGRVGRGEHASHCMLMAGYQLSEDGHKRLDVMVQTQDGFRIAEADLEIRGPGELLGTRQAGMPDLRVGNLLTDAMILQSARKAAFELVAKYDIANEPQFEDLSETLKDRWGKRLEIASIA